MLRPLVLRQLEGAHPRSVHQLLLCFRQVSPVDLTMQYLFLKRLSFCEAAARVVRCYFQLDLLFWFLDVVLYGFLVLTTLLVLLPIVDEVLQLYCRLCNIAKRCPDHRVQHVLVPNNLELVCTECASAQLMSLLPRA